MIILDAIADWLQLNSTGIVTGLILGVLFLISIAYHVDRQINSPK